MTQRLCLPGTSKGGATFKPGAVLEALDYFGIVDPTEVKFTAGIHRKGAHRYAGPGQPHLITVSTYLSPEEAGRTLWHELCHAAQREYLGVPEFVAQYRQESASKGYLGNKFEVEARQHSDLNTEIPLAK